METRFKPGDRVVVLDFDEVGDPHFVGYGDRMRDLIGSVCTVKSAEYLPYVRRENYHLEECAGNFNYDGVWLRAATEADERPVNAAEIDSFFEEFGVSERG